MPHKVKNISLKKRDKDAQKRMKNYYDESSLPEDVSLAAEVPEEYGAPRRSGPSSSPPFSTRRKPRQ